MLREAASDTCYEAATTHYAPFGRCARPSIFCGKRRMSLSFVEVGWSIVRDHCEAFCWKRSGHAANRTLASTSGYRSPLKRQSCPIQGLTQDLKCHRSGPMHT